jgi:phosphate acyltransferase
VVPSGLPIAVDAMGADQGPAPLVDGALRAEADGIAVLLVGDEPTLRALLPASSRIRIRHAAQVVSMAEAPAVAVRRKPESSIVRSVDAVREGVAAGAVSCGNTGAAMAAALFGLGRIKGVERPALTTVAPRSDGGRLVVLDLGANVDCRPSQLAQFAIMGDIFARTALELPKPRVGLLSNGEELGKGNELVRAANPLLAALDLEFVGNVEPTGAFRGACDVLVTDGFTGNVMLKTVEATADVVAKLMRNEVGGALSRALGSRLLAPIMRRFRERTDARAVGGALLLGVQGLVVVGHGRSDARAVHSAIRHTAAWAASGLVDRTSAAIEAALRDAPGQDSALPPRPGTR